MSFTFWKNLNLDRMIGIVFLISYSAAVIAYLFHYVSVNPQYDNQVIWYAQGLFDAAYEHKLFTYFMEVHKYPNIFLIPFAAFYKSEMFFLGDLSPVTTFLTARMVSVVYAIGTLFLLRHLSLKLFGNVTAVWLLMTSLLFMLFTTAVRPHMAVAFWTLATFACALRLERRVTFWNILLGFGAAFCAFGTLQSGLLAFLFPVWAILSKRRYTMPAYLILAIGMSIVTVAAAFVIGYPWMLAPFLTHAKTGFDVTLGGHGVGLAYTFEHGVWLTLQLCASEIFLIVFAVIGLLRLRTHRDEWHPAFLPILLYLFLFCAVFLFHTISVGRFFLPTLPLLALLGTNAFRHSPRIIRRGVLLVSIFILCKLTFLAISPDTYQQTNLFLSIRSGLIYTRSIPAYFFTTPSERFITTNKDIPYTRTIIISDQVNDVPPKEYWSPCFHAISSGTSNEIMFLWNETPWALFHVFEARALGPNITIFCAKTSA